MKIFISYSSKDRDLVTKLASDLGALGHDVWFDAELLRMGGQQWWTNILSNLRQCDLFLFGLTPNSLASDPCKREYGYAYALHKRILPIMLQTVDVAVLPEELQALQIVDYRELSKQQGFSLAASLNNLPPAQAMPDPLPPEPETPMSPLTRLTKRLDAPSLSGMEQIEIVFELEPLFKNPQSRASAEGLLRRLHERDDLITRVSDKIRDLIPDISGVLPRPVPAANRRRTGWVIAAVVFLLLLGGGGLFVSQLSKQSGSATPTSASPSMVAVNSTATAAPVTNTNTAFK